MLISFFVISGYLISRILFNEINNTGTINFLKFYERRARRILPILFTVLLLSFPFAYKYLLPHQFIEYSQSNLASIFFSSNIFFYLINTQYGAEDSLLQPFLHTWSLGVEEQFYIIFPIIILFVFRYSKKYFFLIFSLLIFSSLIYAELTTSTNKEFSFFIIFSRFWELGIGGIVGWHEVNYGRTKNSFFNHVMPIFGISILLYSVITFDENTKHPGIFTIIPVLGTSLIIAYSQTKKRL